MKSKQFPIRLSDDVRQLLQDAADKEGVTLTEYIKQAAIDKANSVNTPKASVYTGVTNVTSPTVETSSSVNTPQPKKKSSVHTPKPSVNTTNSDFERFKRLKATESRPIERKHMGFGLYR